jgi:hypothetical protein
MGPERVHVAMEGRGGEARVENFTFVVRALVLWVVELELLFENVFLVDMRTSNCLKASYQHDAVPLIMPIALVPK